jgi:sulfur-carrier protein
MAIRFNIPGPLRGFAAGRRQVEIGTSAATLSEALEALWIVCPGMRDRVMTEQGQIRQHVSIFVGNEDVRYEGGLKAKVPAEAEISILAAVSGG